jgi:hypothetical protein
MTESQRAHQFDRLFFGRLQRKNSAWAVRTAADFWKTMLQQQNERMARSVALPGVVRW